ncbi:MAG: hypothetical protein SXQ77_13645 [Halobacteria archaeon]|nr:hypothetical protein [Halobacteria archaeon]
MTEGNANDNSDTNESSGNGAERDDAWVQKALRLTRISLLTDEEDDSRYTEERDEMAVGLHL